MFNYLIIFMSDEKKKLNGMTIEVRNKSIKFIHEKNTEPWWRNALDRTKDGFLCPEIAEDIQKIATNLTVKCEDGLLRGKYNLFMTNLPPNPKSSQGNMKTDYMKHIKGYLHKKEVDLKKFYDKQIIVYLAIYLRPERFETNDVDNFIKGYWIR